MRLTFAGHQKLLRNPLLLRVRRWHSIGRSSDGRRKISMTLLVQGVRPSMRQFPRDYFHSILLVRRGFT